MGRRLRLANKPTKPTPHPVTVVKVDPGVWTTALELASGDAKRIEICGPEAVIVRNK